MGWMQTYTGRQFWPAKPRAEDVCIEDIAHALSLQCRFNGHCGRFYSVAEHSVRVAEAVPPGFKLEGLLHDAAEAYIGDMIRPLKGLMPRFGDMEGRVYRAIAKKFGIPPVVGLTVKFFDDVLLATEARDLLGDHPAPWEALPKPLPGTIEPWAPKKAERRFLDLFYILSEARGD